MHQQNARHNVDTLIVVDSLKKYLGTVSITDIRLTGHVVDSIGPLIRCNMPTVQTEDNARACFDQLIESGSSYLVVLNPDQTVARNRHQDQHGFGNGGTAVGVNQ